MYHTHGSFFTNYICPEFFKFFEKFHFVQCNINIFENNHLINENFKITTILLILANIERVWIFNQFFKISAYFILRQIAFVSWTYWTVQSDGQQNGHGQIINNMIKATMTSTYSAISDHIKIILSKWSVWQSMYLKFNFMLKFWIKRNLFSFINQKKFSALYVLY